MRLRTNAQDSRLLENLVVRQMQASDLPALEWEGEYRHFRRVYADAFDRFQRGLSVLWIAELPAWPFVIGQVFIQLTCDRPELANGIDRAYLYSFRVRPNYRSKGIGTRMMQVVEDDLRARGYQCVTLNVARDNYDAQRLYFKRGYRVIAAEPGNWSYPDEEGIWRHVEEPAWRMEKRLR